MDKGIRPAAVKLFAATLPIRREKGNTEFRKTVMCQLMTDFGCTNPAAATHYNHAFQEYKKLTPQPEGALSIHALYAEDGTTVVQPALGRPEGKNNGGRKKGSVKAVAPAADTPPASTDGAVVGDAANSEAPAGAALQLQAPDTQEEAAPAAVKTYKVTKKANGEVVATGISLDAATGLVAAAKAAKKSTLVYTEEVATA